MRKSIEEYFLRIAKVVGERSTCDRGRVGAVIVKDKNILATGYSGSPYGMPHCDDVGHEMENNSCIRTTHAEQNAIVQAARNGIAINSGVLYCTTFPCYVCAKMIVNSGIKEVFVIDDYHKSKRSKELFKKANIKYVIKNNEEL